MREASQTEPEVFSPEPVVKIVKKQQNKRNYYYDVELTDFLIKVIEDKTQSYATIADF